MYYTITVHLSLSQFFVLDRIIENQELVCYFFSL